MCIGNASIVVDASVQSFQPNSNGNQSNTLTRCASVGRQFRSGSVATMSNRFNQTNANCMDSDGNDARSINQESDGPATPRQRALSTIDLSFGNRSSHQNWPMPQPQFMHNHGYQFHYPVIMSFYVHFCFNL